MNAISEPPVRQSIRFLRHYQIITVNQLNPTTTVLDYLRLDEKSCGTKEGCAEGDCGACTVAVGTLTEGEVHYHPVNSCIHLLGMLDGKTLISVDDLADDNQTLHPVQQAMVDQHASQCGFCTPGFVMSLFTLYHSRTRRGQTPDRQAINDWLAGNLCRCTGYRPIVDAAMQSCCSEPSDQFSQSEDAIINQLSGLGADDRDLLVTSSDGFFAAPTTLDSLATLYQQNPDATLVGGATDVGLWVTKHLRELGKIIYTGRTRELREIIHTTNAISVGSAVTYTDAYGALASMDADIGEVLRRLGSVQVRSAGTLGGNIANGSPIGDSPPLLIALDTTLTLRCGPDTRTLPLTDFFIDYGKQDRQPGELLTSIEIPRLLPGQHLRCFKISKRFDQDISALLGVFRLDVDGGGMVTDARVVFGGMAATPRRATITEQKLTGLTLGDTARWDDCIHCLADDFAPISDMRASADYRINTARHLLHKALLEIHSELSGSAPPNTRIIHNRNPIRAGQA